MLNFILKINRKILSHTQLHEEMVNGFGWTEIWRKEYFQDLNKSW